MTEIEIGMVKGEVNLRTNGLLGPMQTILDFKEEIVRNKMQEKIYGLNNLCYKIHTYTVVHSGAQGAHKTKNKTKLRNMKVDENIIWSNLITADSLTNGLKFLN